VYLLDIHRKNALNLLQLGVKSQRVSEVIEKKQNWTGVDKLSKRFMTIL
jgi:hypothetical protein